HLDNNKRSTLEIHWTRTPGTQLHVRSDLTSRSLLKAMDFATNGNCDNPANPNTWCHGQMTIPQGIQPGVYSFVWFWKFDQNPVGEEYTTCFEVRVSANGPRLLADGVYRDTTGKILAEGDLPNQNKNRRQLYGEAKFLEKR